VHPAVAQALKMKPHSVWDSPSGARG
jgi:hypothetical protein